MTAMCHDPIFKSRSRLSFFQLNKLYSLYLCILHRFTVNAAGYLSRESGQPAVEEEGLWSRRSDHPGAFQLRQTRRSQDRDEVPVRRQQRDARNLSVQDQSDFRLRRNRRGRYLFLWNARSRVRIGLSCTEC